jgi:hypothetical protein
VSDPVLMTDLIRELQAIAAVAERSDDLEVVSACRRAQSLLARLHNQFLDDLIADQTPGERAA